MTRTRTRPFAELATAVKADPVRRARIESEKRAIRAGVALAELRARQARTQQEMATSLGVSQANISRIEHEEDLYLSTLRAYVAALGGCLEVNAVFPDGTVTFIPAAECCREGSVASRTADGVRDAGSTAATSLVDEDSPARR